MADATEKPSYLGKRQMHLNFFETACTGSHMAAGQWKNPADNSRYKDRLEYYLWMAKLAERGKITSIFFADTYGGHEVYQNSYAAALRSGSLVALLDPVVLIPAMASVTKSVSFAVTGSTSYISPYILARTWSTLDHVTRGRVGWNVVTSFSESAANAMGKEVLPPAERYVAAQEYMDIVYRFWEESWDDGAQVWQVEPEMAYDPSRVHRVEYDGSYHKTSAFGPSHPSPQRTPVIFQAGASKPGIEFAGRHAEGIYTDMNDIPRLLEYTKKVRAEAAANGRNPSDIKFFTAIMPILGRTVEEAEAKYEAIRKNISVHGGLAKFSGYCNIDMSQFPLDEPFSFEGKDSEKAGITGVIKNMEHAFNRPKITPRHIGELLSLGGTVPIPIGTPEMVADEFEKWLNLADIDGFNISYMSNPQSFEDVVNLLVPELQKRGVMWEDYLVPGGTFRENLHGRPGESGLADDHPARALKKQAGKAEVELEA